MIEEKDFTSGAFSNKEFRYHIKKGFTKEERQQILDECEKARKWDELALDEEDKDITLHGARIIKQNQKLRELIEKRVRERTQADTIFVSTDFYAGLTDDLLTKIFQQLLEENKE